MTIHKSKGLEFDTVILAGLGRGVRGSEAQLLQWLERPGESGGSDLLLAALTEQGRDKDPVYQCVSRMQAQRQLLEDGRLLYVAVTRARKRLHLVGHSGLDEDTGEPKPPASRTLLAQLWPALEPEFHVAARRVLQSQSGDAGPPAASPPTQRIYRMHVDWRPPPPPPSIAWPAPAARAAAHEAAAIEFDWVGETARHVGTVVHRYLQRIAEEGAAQWDSARIAAARSSFRAALRAQGVPASELEPASARVQRALEGVLADARGRWILAADHAEAACELRLTAWLDGEIVNVALDRTFVDERGTRWIVDYKTGTHEGGDLDAFLDREQERYREQLERYAKILAGLDARPVRVALYFPLLRAWREWGV
jgi:ATP-dependent exoDNAse (exonuclease V) beta subunit